MNEFDIVVVGAGASGLAAARELAAKGNKVLILEAHNRPGGRIKTIWDERFALPVEAGAEFIHGKLPVTLGLLEEAGIGYRPLRGKMWRLKEGKPVKTDDFMEGWDLLMERLKALQEDRSIAQFLEENFSEERYAGLRKSVLQFVQGYDAADAARASAFALCKEWEADDEEHQYRPENGYGELIDFLLETCEKNGARIELSSPVHQIRWEKGRVEVATSGGRLFQAARALVTLPLGVWQAPEGAEGKIAFEPALPQKAEAARQMGFGSVIKIALQCSHLFWEEEIPYPLKRAGFIFSDAFVPTWWTQLPENVPVLTGWLAGPKAAGLPAAGEEDILSLALASLASIFGVKEDFIRSRIKASIISNWTADPYTRGAYSYATLQTPTARQVLAAPVENTLFFAGEAFYEGPEAGTVEGALSNGISVARQMMNSV